MVPYCTDASVADTLIRIYILQTVKGDDCCKCSCCFFRFAKKNQIWFLESCSPPAGPRLLFVSWRYT